jgi:hypothetical protein
MKFSFESQQHRDDLAEELKKTDKFERMALLEEKRKTLKYILGQHIKEFTRENDKRGQDEIPSSENIPHQEKSGKKEIIGKWEYGEYKVEVETIDISDQIPESMQIVYDMNRLLEVEASFSEDDVSRDWYAENRDQMDPVNSIVKKYIKMAEKERDEPLTKDDGTQIDDEELTKIAEQAKKDFAVFREKATGGLVNSPDVFYHTIGAYTEGFKYDWYDGDTMINQKGVARTLRNRFPYDRDGSGIQEKPLEIDENLFSYGLFVHSGKIVYDNPLKPLMLIDGASGRFLNEIHRYKNREMKDEHILGARYGMKLSKELPKALEAANTGDQFGVKWMSKDPNGVNWLRIADQIFDPYHGRLIKIRDVDDTHQSQAAE